MRTGIALTLAVLPLLAAGCAIERADTGAPYTTAAGPAQVDNKTAEVRQVMEVIRPQAFGQF